MKKRKICIVTGTRAEYGLLYFLMKSLDLEKKIDLQIIATGMHLSSNFGMTYKEIEKDGFNINKKIEILFEGDSAIDISKATGRGLSKIAQAFKELKPDIVVLLGDRFEILAASISATFMNIPIAHIHGGETTEGAYDEAMRHSITKMSWWHFVAASDYKKRVIQLGEDPSRIFNVGGLGVDAIKKTNLLSKKELMKNTGITFGKKNLLLTYHPVTLEKKNLKKNINELLQALKSFEDIYLIFTMPNADAGNKIIKREINKFVLENINRSISFINMGHINYLSTLQFVDGVIGNSSSGLTEAPSFKIGSINIGDRQKGRLKAESVIDCKPIKIEIKKSIVQLFSSSFQKRISKVNNPYGEGFAIERIVKLLKDEPLPSELKKPFYDLK